LKYSPQPLGSEPLRDLDRGDPPFVDVQHDLRDELGRDMRLGEDELLDPVRAEAVDGMVIAS
jgi:hypothetical protein